MAPAYQEDGRVGAGNQQRRQLEHPHRAGQGLEEAVDDDDDLVHPPRRHHLRHALLRLVVGEEEGVELAREVLPFVRAVNGTPLSFSDRGKAFSLLKAATIFEKFRKVLLAALALPLEDHLGLDGVPADRQRHVEEWFLVVEGPVYLRAVPEQDPATGRRLPL